MPITARFAAASARAYGMFRTMVSVAVDPFFQYVTTLLHGDGTNGAQNNTFIDSSTNNFTITRNGNTTQGSFSPFSQKGWSNYFNGSSDYFTVPAQTALSFGTSDFTIEGWFYLTSSPSVYAGVIDARSGAIGAAWACGVYNSGGLKIDFLYSASRLTGALIVPINTWIHIAITRASGTIRLFLNGTVDPNTVSYSSAINANRAAPLIGSTVDPYYFPGYISNLRVVNGTALYTASFTPPTSPLTAITNTQLLTCQSNRFIDNSSNAFAITVVGAPSIQPVSPFYATTAYSTALVGGSGYFDGSGDYLSIADAASMELGSGNWTIEMWVNTTNSTAYSALFTRDNGGVVAGSYVILLNGASADGIVSFWSADVNSFSAAVLSSGTTSCRDGGWHHIAVVRNSNTLTMYIDGISKSTATYTGAFGNTAQPILVGAETGYSRAYTGYMADVRLVVGSAVYTTNFTPPTAPLTAITNTQLLLNFTNGGIYDNAAAADYETVGNAQVSTAVVKYGTGSMKMTAAGDYLKTDAPSNLMAFGTGDFTIECWVYFNAIAPIHYIWDWRPSGLDGAYPAVYVDSLGQIFYYANGSATAISGQILSSGNWYHIALCRTAYQTKLFVNGTQTGAIYSNDTVSYLAPASRPLIGESGFAPGTGYLLNGYIDDFRVTKGIGRYPYTFTPPTAALPNIGGSVTPTADPYFNYVSLLLSGNGTNGAQNNTFIDSSANALTITRNGNTTQGSASPYSQTGWCNYFAGTFGNKLTTPANAALAMGTGDFTWECWVNIPQGLGNYQAFIDSRSVSLTDGFFFGLTTGARTLCVVTNAVALTSTNSILPGEWNHVALVRSSGTLSIYLNGTNVGSLVTSFNLSNNVITIGDHVGGTNATVGYISNVRITKGGALYTANFTPPALALTTTVSAGTVSLLTCQSNRQVDNSVNAFALTPTATVPTQPYSPFAPAAAYSTGTVGGAIYLDGTGDYLSVASNAVLNLGSNNFTIEFWYYGTGGSTQYFLSKGTTGSGNAEYYCSITSARIINFGYSATGSSYTVISSSPTTVVQNAWNHIAITRSGNTYYMFLNGIQVATGAITATLNAGTAALQIAALNSASLIVGNLADVRIVNGTAVYTAAFTPPTSALTAITNTAFLLSATNAGIYDATAKNICETLGNAQISTTQSKFGGSSMYFDGSGDYLSFRRIQQFYFDIADYTVECWFYLSAAQAATSVLWCFHTTATTYFGVYNNTATNPNVLTVSDGTVQITGTTTLTTGQWYHCALSRFNGNTKLFLNGVQEGSTWVTTTTPGTSGASFRIAAAGTVTQIFTGYIDDFRITTGIARYTSNFTPPTSAFLLQ